uniref:sigma factor-like helix-turn-helix DNA-binding protein n=1 Tax=Alistipes shahii TaxID=328814 RepID=UPI003FEE4336
MGPGERGSPPPELAPAISRLPEQSRKVLLMSYWENKKNAAIATELSISVRTVETILYKVVKKLRGEIKKK